MKKVPILGLLFAPVLGYPLLGAFLLPERRALRRRGARIVPALRPKTSLGHVLGGLSARALQVEPSMRHIFAVLGLAAMPTAALGGPHFWVIGGGPTPEEDGAQIEFKVKWVAASLRQLAPGATISRGRKREWRLK